MKHKKKFLLKMKALFLITLLLVNYDCIIG